MTMGVEGEDSYASQFTTFLITSGGLSPVTESVSTSGWRSISQARGWGLDLIVPKTFLGKNSSDAMKLARVTASQASQNIR